jgi:tetratricopeptide (TPR) repeat protein
MLDERLAVLRGDNERAYEAMRQLSDMAPSSEWTWLLARHAVFTNRPRVAIEALGRVDPEQGWISGFGLYWSFLLDAQHMNGNYEEELSTARRSRERYLNNPFSLTFRHARALVALGRIQEARLLIDSLTVKAAVPLAEHMERALLGYLTSEARAHGYPEVALEWSSLDSASHPLAPFALGMKESEAIRALQVLQRRERWSEAQPFAKYLVEVNSSYDDYHLLLGIGAAHVGDRTEALRQAEWFSRQQRPYEHGGQRLFQARIVAALGDKAGAVELLQRALNEGTQFDAFLHWGFESLKDYAPYQELMQPRR